MRLFDLLSEFKIKDWLKKRQDPDYIAPPSPDKTELGQPYESFLFDEIKKLIIEASEYQGEERKKRLSKVTSLEIQLLASLEQGGYNMMATNMEKNILKLKSEYLWNKK
ncbi:hypothetical protein [Pseudemcibacter aquimaris]|uniref:hypothetical protein n=1 Tax=Pseudemcibacter aquimaris TaxID=2857064 RepID=UPI00201220C6|nr:hypothetical protein [Pseudemcibacter aquimaris]MCC3860668.1 hypothetical protein [Pseudemcibacter aquimaris]WDU59488.1 hypothetical protein KW060_04345 [Pseudemcibacter aquimaris]